MADKAGKIKVGHGLDPTVQLGPLVSKEQHTKVHGFIESGRKEGVEGRDRRRRRRQPGLLRRADGAGQDQSRHEVVREEIFGPVVCVQSFDDDDLDQVAKFANDTEYGLQASIWTHNLQGRPFARAQDQGRHDLGQQPQLWRSGLAFGGYKQSGWGREMGKEVMEHYTETKSVAINLV